MPLMLGVGTHADRAKHTNPAGKSTPVIFVITQLPVGGIMVKTSLLVLTGISRQVTPVLQPVAYQDHGKGGKSNGS
mgnify:CR=1 FL=1|jgi:hypothetical protein